MSAVAGRWRRRLTDIITEIARDVKTAAQTRFGGNEEGPEKPVVVFTGTLLQAQVVLGRLLSEDIPAMVQSESAGVALGLTVGLLGQAQVLVPRVLAPRAQVLLEEGAPVEASVDEGGKSTSTDE